MSPQGVARVDEVGRLDTIAVPLEGGQVDGGGWLVGVGGRRWGVP